MKQALRFFVFILCITWAEGFAQADCAAQESAVEIADMQPSAGGCIIDGQRLIALPGYEVVLNSQTGDAECRQTSGGGSGVPFVTCGPCTSCHSYEMKREDKFKCTGICEIDPCHFF